MAQNIAAALTATRANRFDLPFLVLLFYLFVEYARPAFLMPLHPALLAQLLVAWFLIANKKKVARVFKEKYFSWFLWLLALMVLHVFLARNNFWAYMHLRIVLTYLLFSLGFCVFLDSVDKCRRFLTFFVAIMSLCAIDRLVGLNLFGASGTMGDENDFALAMNVALPISFFLARASGPRTKALLLAAGLLLILGNIVSESRGGFIGLATVAGYCWFNSRHKFQTLIAVCIVAVLAWNFATPQFRAEVTGIGLNSAETDTGKGRIELWKVGWRAFVHNPVIGVGQGNMPVVMEIYQYDARGKSFWERGLWGRAVHSVYFTILPELGLVGLLLLGLMGRDLWRKYRQLLHFDGPRAESDAIASMTRGIMGGLLAFLVTGAFLSAFYYPELWAMAALLTALFGAATPNAAVRKTGRRYKAGMTADTREQEVMG